jgi:hypothetical protein
MISLLLHHLSIKQSKNQPAGNMNIDVRLDKEG